MPLNPIKPSIHEFMTPKEIKIVDSYANLVTDICRQIASEKELSELTRLSTLTSLPFLMYLFLEPLLPDEANMKDIIESLENYFVKKTGSEHAFDHILKPE